MYIQGSQTSTMLAANNLRVNGLNLAQSAERVSSGARVNRGSDDPSGLAIGKGMQAQLRGASTAIMNLEDGISLVRTADSALAQIQDILARELEIAITGANEAVQFTVTNADPNIVSFSSTRKLFEELDTLEQEIYRLVQRSRFNTKELLFGGFDAGQALQAGPDAATSHRIAVVIPDMSSLGRENPVALPGNITHAQFVSAFQASIDRIHDNISFVSDARAGLGVLENKLTQALDNLKIQHINVSGARSRIMDSDMAIEIVGFTKAQILENASINVLSKANNAPEMVFTLFDAVGLDGSQRVSQ
jgi:flagellin